MLSMRIVNVQWVLVALDLGTDGRGDRHRGDRRRNGWRPGSHTAEYRGNDGRHDSHVHCVASCHMSFMLEEVDAHHANSRERSLFGINGEHQRRELFFCRQPSHAVVAPQVRAVGGCVGWESPSAARHRSEMAFTVAFLRKVEDSSIVVCSVFGILIRPEPSIALPVYKFAFGQ